MIENQTEDIAIQVLKLDARVSALERASKKQCKQLSRYAACFAKNAPNEGGMVSFSDACEYLGLAPSYLYKLIFRRQITHYKPNGKKVYFQVGDLNKWLMRNRVEGSTEVFNPEDTNSESQDKYGK